MEKLGQLRSRAVEQDRWDLIVVDTPPSRSALDFLDAPRRLGSFLDGRFIRLLAAPAKAGGRAYMRVLSAGFGVFTSVLSKILGGQVLTDVQQFVSSIDTLFGGFRERADETYAMLKADDTAFVVVTAPERDALREASYFIERLEGDDMPLAGVVLNRVATTASAIDEATATSAANRLAALGADTSAAVLRIHAQLVATHDRQRRLAERLTSAHRHVPISVVPAMPTDVTDLADLRLIGDELADG